MINTRISNFPGTSIVYLSLSEFLVIVTNLIFPTSLKAGPNFYFFNSACLFFLLKDTHSVVRENFQLS